MGTGFLSRRQSGRGVALTSHIRLFPRLGMSGAVPLLSPYDFVARTRTNLPFTLIIL